METKEKYSTNETSRVHVYVRSRPLVATSNQAEPAILFPSNKLLVVPDGKYDTTYQFDHVFSDDTTNNEVCEVVCEPLITTVLNGFNGSFMVYGQTGTGKTHTILSEDGLISSTIEKLFNIIDDCKEFSYTVFLSYLQIYQDKIYDLLFNSDAGALMLREHPQEGVIVEGLSEKQITTTVEAKQLLEFGRNKLIVAETKMVRFSSRSHALCVLKVEKNKKHGFPQKLNFSSEFFIGDILSSIEGPIKGKLYICDLAGSERLKKTEVSGRRLDEARYINSSLLELGNVIHALAAKNTAHIPFRNSTLTRILKESLGGNSKANLMICISPSLNDLKETKCSLNFGQRAMKVIKHSSKNVESRTDSHWLSNPFKRRKNNKIDYKALSEYLTSKLKELESAYKEEKENLRQIKKRMSKRTEKAAILGIEYSSEESTPTHNRLSALPEEVLSSGSFTVNTKELKVETSVNNTVEGDKQITSFLEGKIPGNKSNNYPCIEIAKNEEDNVSVEIDKPVESVVKTEESFRKNEENKVLSIPIQHSEELKAVNSVSVETINIYENKTTSTCGVQTEEESVTCSSGIQTELESEIQYVTSAIDVVDRGMTTETGFNDTTPFSHEIQTIKDFKEMGIQTVNQLPSNSECASSEICTNSTNLIIVDNFENVLCDEVDGCHIDQQNSLEYHLNENSLLPVVLAQYDDIEVTDHVESNICDVKNITLSETEKQDKSVQTCENDVAEFLEEDLVVQKKEIESFSVTHDVAGCNDRMFNQTLNNNTNEMNHFTEELSEQNKKELSNCSLGAETNVNRNDEPVKATENVTSPLVNSFMLIESHEVVDCVTKEARLVLSPTEESTNIHQAYTENVKVSNDCPDVQDDSFGSQSQLNYGRKESCRSSFSSIDSETERHYHKDTKHAKKSLKRVKNKYEVLLKQFEALTSEKTMFDSELSNSGSCYNLVIKFKNELEQELDKAREQLDMVAASNDETSDIEEDFSFNEPLRIEEGKYNEIQSKENDIRKEKYDTVLTSDGPQKAPQVESKLEPSIEPVLTTDSSNCDVQISNKMYDINNNQPECENGYAKVSEEVVTRKKTNPMGEVDKTVIIGEINPEHLKWISDTLTMSDKKAKRNEKITLAAIENTEIKKELLLTKLEKIRLEAVLSCVMMTSESNDMTKEFQQLSVNSMRKLTSSKSTLSSSASCALLPVSSNAPTSIVQHATSPLKKYSYTERFLGAESSNTTSPRGRKTITSEGVTRSVQTDLVTQWLKQDGATSLPQNTQSIVSSSPSNTSSDFDISSMSNVSGSPRLLTRLSPYGKDGLDDDDLSLDEDMKQLDGLILKYRKKDRFSISCLPFLRKRSLKKRMKKMRDLENSEMSSKTC